MSKEITIDQCRELRACINDFTSGCLLTEDEYNAIMLILGNAANRLEKKWIERDGID